MCTLPGPVIEVCFQNPAYFSGSVLYNQKGVYGQGSVTSTLQL